MKKLIPVGVFVVIILGASFLFIYNSSSPLTPGSKQTNESSINTSFSNPKKSAHYESNTPEHGSTLAGVPINVVINFNFDLAVPSEKIWTLIRQMEFILLTTRLAGQMEAAMTEVSNSQ